ncbi:YifB family Mg chelatase-like AAA ATPase [Lentibacillus salicampi]|uniref:ATP-binding protein n=1 Tax=Lentibacillus salicampi TaxID=175306 RepID=A0A4Y9A8F6_9BACI|nr:YifB family Mg chelatase-like AAA ATPase [Lentibacillus salicampi]TFJ92116.1 ATP-binding protein [Lentibacillus salicampi]
MAIIVSSIGLKGIEGYRVDVEVQLLPGVEGVHIVGLPDASVKESKDRVMAALYANDCEVPDKKIVINLSPAEQKKNSPIFDLAMAIGIMKEAGDIKDAIPDDAAFLGVLSLDGTIKPVDGMLPAIVAAKKEGIKLLYLPPMQDTPFPQIDGMEFCFVETLHDVVASFSGQLSSFALTSMPSTETTSPKPVTYDKDFQHILGHKQAKRALEIAAAGGHNVLMTGPPGCGKSLLAETFSSILPLLSETSQFDVMSIYQLAGMTNENYQIPPFRDPHHSASAVSLIGGGANPKPGEVSLAHRGVSFLDEMAEFPKRTLDMLRQPVETGKVTISRAASTVTYPSQFLLLGAMNPCPCGFLGSRHYYCTCTAKQITAYNNRVSGPIQDRMDILLKLDTVALDKETTEHNETSTSIRARVAAARKRQYERYGDEILNASAPNETILGNSELTEDQQKMMQQWASKHNWSTRVQMKILRLARTISDLSGDEAITNESIWEAVTMRRTRGNKVQKGMIL